MTDPQNATDSSAPEKGPGCPSTGRTAVAGPGLASTGGSPAGGTTEGSASDAPSTPPAAPVPAAYRPEVAGEPESGQDGTAGREAAPVTVWISQLDDALIVHASEAGARGAAVAGWRAVRYDDDPDGPYTWQRNEEQTGAADLVIDTGALVLQTGFRVYPAPVHQP